MHLAIVGNSAAALSALESFRRRDGSSPVTLVCDEPGPAYSRVLLPYYLRRKLSLAGLFIRQMESYERLRAATIFGARVEGVDVSTRRLELATGRSIGFDQLLLATGSSPARPSIPGLDGAAVHHLWTLADAVGLDPLLLPGRRMLVLGSGFVALQAAWAATQRGLHVTLVELEDQILPRVLDAPGARILSAQIAAHGLDVHTGTRTEGLEIDRAGEVHVAAAGLGPLVVDTVIVATGARPNDRLLPACVEPAQPGIPVGATMETEVGGVYAAGDVARGPTSPGGPREIHALWPTAVEQGKVAGANLAGARVSYGGSLSMNVTEMFGLTVASLGRIVEGEGDDAREWHDLADIGYLKLVSRAGVPVGAISLGGSEGAALMGRLRPFVRQKRPLEDMLALLERRDLDQSLVAAATTKEGTRCASSL